MQLYRINSGDWEALRLTPRQHYPPKPKTGKVVVAVDPSYTGQIARPRPPFHVDAPQGIIFGNGVNRNGRRALMVQLGMANPFLDDTLRFMRRSQAQGLIDSVFDKQDEQETRTYVVTLGLDWCHVHTEVEVPEGASEDELHDLAIRELAKQLYNSKLQEVADS